MSFKTILFCLFLYVCLVWVGGAYYNSGPKVQEFGFLWTAVGLIVVLASLLLSRAWGWVSLLRARAASKPKAIVKPAVAVNEDEAAITDLIEEATATLRRAPAYVEKGPDFELSRLPLYFLVGPEGSGKTSTFLNSGLEPQLLAGEARGTGPHLPTRLCNLWLAKGALFVEIGGSAFNSDRWPQILRSFQKRRSQASGWRRFWKEQAQGFELRGVVAFCDVKDFNGASTLQARERLDRQSRDWQRQIGSVAEVFGIDFPLYFLITKCDALPYFSDFFRRIPDVEAEQVLGCSVQSPAQGTDQARSEAAESKSLAKSFTALFHSLADRRVSHLSHEPDPARRPAVYEFPRELKRIRPAIVQFLTTVFRPHPLRSNPRLRGFYFSATGDRLSIQTPADSGIEWADRSTAMDASVLFRGDATQILRPGEVSVTNKVIGSAGIVRRWLFVSELFGKLVLGNSHLPRAVQPDTALQRKQKLACAAVCACCLLLCGAFVTSWTRNVHLLNEVRERADLHRRGNAPTLSELKELETLRTEVARLSAYQREGAPVSMRWGLYAGNGVAGAARDLYFRRFQEVLLNPLNAAVTMQLQKLPTTPPPGAPYNPIFRLLQTHLMISSGSCTPDPALVSDVLKKATQEIVPTSSEVVAPASENDWQPLANRQIDFYTHELHYGNPCKLAENPGARDRARQYLGQIRGVDRLYANILAGAEKNLSTPQRLRDLSPDYGSVLNGSDEIGSVWSKEGWSYVERASQSSDSGSSAEACVLGDNKRFGIAKSDTQTERAIQRLFVHDYVDRWRRFVEAFSVKGYGSSADAARKLEILSDHKSPLLAIFAMASNQTNFPKPAVEPEVLDRVKPIVKKWLPTLGAAPKAAVTLPAQPKESTDSLNTPGDIARFFQPVHWVVAPASETWVGDKNSAYIEALAQLAHSMQELSKSSSTPDQALFQAAGQNYDKALDEARKLARGFQPIGVGGLDMTAERLLEAPIRPTQRFIINPDSAAAGKVNGQLQQLCSRLRTTLRKYPFHASPDDATVAEVAALFAPATGAIWKFQADCLGDLTVKEGSMWKSKDPAKKPQVTQEMVGFLTRAQAVTDALYPAGATQPHFTYTLRPKLDPSYKDATLELEIDGQVHTWTSSLQKQFAWPVAGAGKTGVIGRIKTGSVSFPFASRGGTWAIFRVMGDAEPRPLGSKLVEWKYIRGGDGRLEEIQPARLEFVEFPAGVDLFNPKFFEGLQCPGRAVQE